MLSTVESPSQAPSPLIEHVVFDKVTWEQYVTIGETLGPRSNLRLTFDRGRLEIMKLSRGHEEIKSLFGMMVASLTDELDVQRAACGVTACRRQDLDRGFEPDECYYLGETVGKLRGLNLDHEQGPLPNLSIEIDVTDSSIDRQQLYAAMGIRELWRHADRAVTFLRLQQGTTQYTPSPNSVAFPALTSVDVNRFMGAFTPNSGTQLAMSFRRWVRDEFVSR